MPVEFTPDAVPFAVAMVVMVLVGLKLWRLAEERLGLALLLWTGNAALWCFSSMVQMLVTSPGVEVVFHNLRFIWAGVSSLAVFLIIAAYTDREQWFRHPRLSALLGIPALTVGLILTNHLHGLVLAGVESATSGPLLTAVQPGPWLAVHVAFAYVVLAVAFYWLVAYFLRQHRGGLYRGQAGFIIVAFLVSMSPNFLFHLGYTAVDYTPVGNAGGALALAVALFRYRLLDVTPVARHTVVEEMDTAMVVVDTEDKIIDANRQAASILDRPVEDLIGLSLAQGLTDFPTLHTAVAESAGERTVSIDIDGEERQYEVETSTMRDSTDTEVGRVILCSDVTGTVERRRRLETQKETLERQNERLDQFASVISHDLRNPLGIARTYTEFAEESGDAEDFEAIRESHERMDAMIDNMLTMARAEMAVENVESVDLSGLAERAWETAQTDGAGLALEIPDGVSVEGDPALLQNVFENLFRNAAEHNDRQVTVTVGTMQEVESSSAGFYIEDDGVGFESSPTETIFEYGQTSTDQGTGLGLSIVRDLIEAHGWEIRATDGAAGGARFEVYTDGKPAT